MPQMTPIQESFSAGEISPLMFQRSETEGYQQGLASLVNMFADSRGPAYSRGGMRYGQTFAGDDGRILALPVNDLFFYTAIFSDQLLSIGTLTGHNPLESYTMNSNFNGGDDSWVFDTDGNNTSKVIFLQGAVTLEVDDKNNRYVYVSQEFTLDATGNHSLLWSIAGNASLDLKIGTTEDGDDVFSQLTPSGRDQVVFNATATTLWVTARLDSDNADELLVYLAYLGVTDEVPQPVEFVTPYLEQHLPALQGVQSPSGGAIYILHELYPPYKIMYDRATDTVSWQIVEFIDDSTADADNPCGGVASTPPEWVEGSYPSCGDFFEGRLWLGGTVNEPQTFWASKSGCPETFVSDTLTNADSPLKFTMAKYGRIEWMVGFKNLVIGTQNGEHIVTSVGGFIKPDDIQVEQQSSYGSANIQPVQVGDQIFYVSADGRKLRAIQYEWQKDNWLSKDLTFNSEHITEAGIKHMAWQQNPDNLFHCVLNDGTVASLTYERGHNVYGWARVESQGKIIDVTTGPLLGIDYVNVLMQYVDGSFNYENQSSSYNAQFMDSWVERFAEPDDVTVIGLDHLEGFTVQVLVGGATHPDEVVTGGQIILEYPSGGKSVIVGLQFTPMLKTLPFDQGAPAGSGAGWQKRWNKIFIRVLDSTMPLINGERSPERYPSTLMDEPQPAINQEILKVNLGYDKHAQITIEQDLPHRLIVLGVFGELSQSKL